jgi:hypothetical protein
VAYELPIRTVCPYHTLGPVRLFQHARLHQSCDLGLWPMSFRSRLRTIEAYQHLLSTTGSNAFAFRDSVDAPCRSSDAALSIHTGNSVFASDEAKISAEIGVTAGSVRRRRNVSVIYCGEFINKKNLLISPISPSSGHPHNASSALLFRYGEFFDLYSVMFVLQKSS